MKSARRCAWQVINAQRSLNRVFRPAPQVEVPFACLEINLQAKWTGRYSPAKNAQTGPALKAGGNIWVWNGNQTRLTCFSGPAMTASGRKLQQWSDDASLFFLKFRHEAQKIPQGHPKGGIRLNCFQVSK